MKFFCKIFNFLSSIACTLSLSNSTCRYTLYSFWYLIYSLSCSLADFWNIFWRLNNNFWMFFHIFYKYRYIIYHFIKVILKCTKFVLLSYRNSLCKISRSYTLHNTVNLLDFFCKCHSYKNSNYNTDYKWNSTCSYCSSCNLWNNWSSFFITYKTNKCPSCYLILRSDNFYIFTINLFWENIDAIFIFAAFVTV